MGRSRVRGRCACGHRYRVRLGDLPLPGGPSTTGPSTPVRDATARRNAVRWVGTDAPYLGVVIQQAITENA